MTAKPKSQAPSSKKGRSSAPLDQLQWLVNTGKCLKTADGRDVEIWEFQHKKDAAVLSAWAKRFRNHYCRDEQIDLLRKGTGYSRAEYLKNIKFPDATVAPGPSIRAGDFAEILVADYVEFLLKYWVPRTRYADKTIRNESTKGSDLIGFKVVENGKDSKQDTLAIFETKAGFSEKKKITLSRLQDAIDDSVKDLSRKAESLNAIKQRLIDQGKLAEVETVERFQSPGDRPYQEKYGAVAVLSTSNFDKSSIAQAKTSAHPFSGNLALLVIHGDDMMTLVHELYLRAMNEA